MSNFNKVILVGRLTAQPEMRYTQSAKPVTSFTLAVSRNRRSDGKDAETDFIPIVAWQRLAEICAQYLGKGSLVIIEGRLQTRSYTTNDGQKRKAYEVVASEMRMLGRPKGAEEVPEIPFDEGERDRTQPHIEDSQKDLDHLGIQDLGMEDDVPF